MSSAEETRRLAGEDQLAARRSLEEQHTEADGLREELAAQRRKLERARRELARRQGYIEALQSQLDARSLWTDDLREVTENLNVQLFERDEEIARLRHGELSLREELAWRRRVEDSLLQRIAELERDRAALEATRLWRWGQGYWRLKRFVRRAMTRGGR